MRGRKKHGADGPSIAEAIQTAHEAADEARVGFPGDCPVCGRTGYLVSIDLAHNSSRSECRHCSIEWVTVGRPDGVRVERV